MLPPVASTVMRAPGPGQAAHQPASPLVEASQLKPVHAREDIFSQPIHPFVDLEVQI